MATLGASYIDLIDLYSRSNDEKLQIATIMELLNETNAVLDDALMMECNSGLVHRTTVRTGLPASTWGQLYKGVPSTKSTTAQVDDGVGFCENRSTVDTRLLEISNNPDAVRLSEATPHLESLSQEVASTVFYGNATTEHEKFTGASPRFNALTGAGNSGQVVSAGGSGSDNTSVWFWTWSDIAAALLYPQGTSAGISRKDHGEQRVDDTNGDAYYAMEETFRWHCGLTIRDWRYISRICNIDVSNMQAGSVDMYSFFRKAYWRLKSHRIPEGRQVIYCNSDVCEALDADSTPTTGTSSSYVRLSPSEVDGMEVMTYRGTPIRQVDSLLNTEATVS